MQSGGSAGQIGVSRSAIYQMAAQDTDLDPELFPPAEDRLLTVSFGDGHPE